MADSRYLLVPEVGIEPTCLQEAGDFESVSGFLPVSLC